MCARGGTKGRMFYQCTYVSARVSEGMYVAMHMYTILQRDGSPSSQINKYAWVFLNVSFVYYVFEKYIQSCMVEILAFDRSACRTSLQQLHPTCMQAYKYAIQLYTIHIIDSLVYTLVHN